MKAEIKLNRPVGKAGKSVRQHYESIARQTGRRPAALRVPPIPSGGERVWGLFTDLSRRRRAGFSGPDPIGWLELDAYARVTGEKLDPWEAEAITTLDDVYLEAAGASEA